MVANQNVPINRLNEMERTGDYVSIKKEAAKKIFNADVKEVNFIDEEAYKYLVKLTGEGDNESIS
jgi:hypothetical protein